MGTGNDNLLTAYGQEKTELRKQKKFCYLGSIITGMGGIEKDIITRI